MRRSWQSPYAMLDGTLSTVADRPRWARPTSNVAAAWSAVCVKLRQAHSVFELSSYHDTYFVMYLCCSQFMVNVFYLTNYSI